MRHFRVQAAGYRYTTILASLTLLLLWLFVQFYLIKVYGGVVTAVDSPVYIEDAHKLLNGIIPEGRNYWYIGYSSFLATIFFLGGGLQGVMLAQMLLSGIAAVCLYILTLEIGKDKVSAFLAVLLYLLWVKIHHWNVFIYSESLFTSFCIIAFTMLVKSKRPWHFAISAFFLVYTFFIRPTGFSFYVGLACYAFSYIQLKKINATALISVAVLLLALSVLLLNKMLEEYILVESYAKAEIIYPNISLGVVPPAELAIPSESYSPVVRLVLFVLYNPLYFLKISLIKLGLFLGNVKPYFSFLHNSGIVLILYPLYFYAVKGYKRLSFNKKAQYFIAGYVLAQAMTVTLTTENWDGRFLVPVLPFIFILSAVGIVAAARKSKLLPRIF